MTNIPSAELGAFLWHLAIPVSGQGSARRRVDRHCRCAGRANTGVCRVSFPRWVSDVQFQALARTASPERLLRAGAAAGAGDVRFAGRGGGGGGPPGPTPTRSGTRASGCASPPCPAPCPGTTSTSASSSCTGTPPSRCRPPRAHPISPPCFLPLPPPPPPQQGRTHARAAAWSACGVPCSFRACALEPSRLCLWRRHQRCTSGRNEAPQLMVTSAAAGAGGGGHRAEDVAVHPPSGHHGLPQGTPPPPPLHPPHAEMSVQPELRCDVATSRTERSARGRGRLGE